MRIIGNLFQNNANFIPKVFGGIDTKNLLAEWSGGWKSIDYTATEDCIILGACANGNAWTLDGVQISESFNTQGVFLYLAIKKGQHLVCTAIFSSGGIKAFGIKY